MACRAQSARRGAQIWSRNCRSRAEAVVICGESKRAAIEKEYNKFAESRRLSPLKINQITKMKKRDYMRKTYNPFSFSVMPKYEALAYSVAPKSVTSTCPVTARDSSLARKSRTFATSIGIQGETERFICYCICPIMAGFRVLGWVVIVIGVMIVDGLTELQRMPVPVKRIAVCFVRPMTAALLVT